MTNERVYVIAEAGVNHNGSLDTALALVDAAAKAGANAVKFQTFVPEALVSRHAPMAEYQKKNTGEDQAQLAMLQRLALSDADHRALLQRCAHRRIDFLSSPFDVRSADFLLRDLKLPRLKLGSGELTNAPLLLHVARSGAPVILSTGMSTLAEVEEALGVLAFGYTQPDGVPTLSAFRQAFASTAGRQALKDKVTLLHCVTEYPCPVDEVNLRALDTLRTRFDLPVGYSDHTTGVTVAIAAAARGACVIEKHFTLDRSLPGPDHAASLEPDELPALVDALRAVERALGDGDKRPARSELKNIPIARKSIVAATAIRKGEHFTELNLTTKRPGNGLSPLRYWELLGKTAERDYAADEVIPS
jgi:N-acetylneuraminate synthase